MSDNQAIKEGDEVVLLTPHGDYLEGQIGHIFLFDLDEDWLVINWGHSDYHGQFMEDYKISDRGAVWGFIPPDKPSINIQHRGLYATFTHYHKDIFYVYSNVEGKERLKLTLDEAIALFKEFMTDDN